MPALQKCSTLLPVNTLRDTLWLGNTQRLTLASVCKSPYHLVRQAILHGMEAHITQLSPSWSMAMFSRTWRPVLFLLVPGSRDGHEQ